VEVCKSIFYGLVLQYLLVYKNNKGVGMVVVDWDKSGETFVVTDWLGAYWGLEG